MVKSLLSILCFLYCFYPAFTQEPTPPPPTHDPIDSAKVFEKVEVEASFKGGVSAWHRFLLTNLNASIPLDNGAPEGRFTVLIQFIVDKQGEISNFKALTKYGYGMEDEAIRVIKESGKWTPAEHGGKKVIAYRKQSITFLIGSELP